MINQDVLSYIKNELARGSSRDDIKKNLIAGGGWTGADVDFHFGVLGEPSLPKIVPRPMPTGVVTGASAPIMVRTPATEQGNLQNLANLMTHSLGTETNLLPATPKSGTNSIPAELETFEPTSHPVQPISTSVATTTNVPSTEISTSHKRYLLKIFFIIIFILLLGGGGAYGYYYYINNQSEKIFAKMLENLAGIKSFEYKGEFSLVAKTGTLSIKQDGVFDASSPSSLSSSQDTTIVADTPEFRGSLMLNTIFLDQFLYIKIVDLPSVFSAYVDSSKVNNRWFAFGTSTLQSATAVRPAITEGLSSIDKEKLDKITENYALYPILKIETGLVSEKINGKNAYHYKAILNKDNARLLVSKLLKLEAETLLTVSSTDQLEQEILTSIDAVDEASAEIWIGKDDYLPYKITTTITIDTAKIKSNTVKSTGKITMNLSILTSKFNEKFIIIAPTESTPIEELVAEIFSALMPPMSQD